MSNIKTDLIGLIETCNDENFLRDMYEMISSHKQTGLTDWWDDLSIEQQNRVEEAIAQYKTGKSVNHDEIKKKLAAWRNR